MDLNARVLSTHHVLDGRHLDHCDTTTFNLLGEIHAFTRMYAERFGRRPPVIVVLASTDLCAAVNIAGRTNDKLPYAWVYEREEGKLSIGGSSSAVLLCEYPTAERWGCEITAPGDRTLGEALIHRATIWKN